MSTLLARLFIACALLPATLAATQTRDGRVQLVSSKNHYVFNLVWLKQLPPAPEK